MEIQQAIEIRRSIRAYGDRPVEREKLEAVLRAGNQAPIFGRLHMSVFAGPEQLQAVDAAAVAGMARSGVPFLENLAAQEGYHPLYGAAALVVLSAPGGLDEKGFNMANVSCAAENMLLAAAGLGSPLTVEGLDPDSTQGDRCVVPYFQQLAGPGRVELDIAQCPDLAPALAVRAALRPGQTARLVNAGRLRLKECDRLAAIPEELNKLGGQLTEGADFLEIRGVERLLGGVADSHNDHRIAMMLAVAATRAEGTVTIRGAESVAKSYPDFWEVYESLGGRVLRQREEREACDM